MAQALTAEMIQQLLSTSKSRGEYDAVLDQFLNSGEAGIEVDIHNGALSGKRAKQAKVGFDNARKKSNENGLRHPGGKNVRVIAVADMVDGPEGKKIENPEGNANEHVYLINTALAGGAVEETEEAVA